MATPLLTHKLVYQTLQGIFVGEDAHVRKLKAVCKTIQKHHQKNVKVKDLTTKYGINRVSEMAKTLLKDQIFASSAKARLRFPDLFEVAPIQISQPTTSQPTTSQPTTSQPTTSQPTTSQPKVTTGNIEVPMSVAEKTCEHVQVDVQTTQPVTEFPQELHTQEKIDIHTLDTVCLPLWDQHRILIRVQYALEKACFTFAQGRLGGVLQKEGWDCAEAVELNRWPKVLLTYQKECNLSSVHGDYKSLPSLLDSITQLRHDAVHRARLSSNKLLQRLTDAALLARLMEDDVCGNFISAIRQKTQQAIEELVSNKALLNRKLSEIKTRFADKRAELDRQEAAVLETTVKEHKGPTISVSGSLDPLYDGFGDTDATHALWSHGCGPARSDNGSSESDSTTKTHEIASAPVSTAQLVTGEVPDAAEEEVETAKANWKKAKKEKKVAQEQANQQEEAENKAVEEEQRINESEVSGELPDGAIEDSREDVEIAQQLSEPLTLLSTVDSSSIELAIADSEGDYWNDKTEDALEVEHYFECPEIVLDSCESNPKHLSNDPPFEQEVVTTDTRDTSSEARSVLDSAAASESPRSDLLEHDQGSFYEPNISPAPACVGQAENHAEESHTKSETEGGISNENNIIDPEASSEQPAATNGPSYLLRSWGQGSWSGSVRIKSLEDDPRLKSLTAANGKGHMTLVST